MLININIHSTLSHLFPERRLKADLTRYDDLPRYLGSMHPKFNEYVQKIYLDKVDEGYIFLDKDLTPIKNEDLMMKVIKKDDEFYIVPSIMGGGGRRSGNLLKFAAIAAAVVFAPQIAAGAKSLFSATAGQSAVAASGYGGTIAGAEAGRMAAFSSTLSAPAAASASAGLGISATTLAVNAGLALVTSLFTQAPESMNSTDQAVRQNNMFGSLNNTVETGTSIPLIYGMHRIAGQLVSGYIDSIEHTKDELIRVDEQFEQSGDFIA